MRRTLALVALSVVVSLTVTATVFLLSRSGKFRTAIAGCCGDSVDAGTGPTADPLEEVHA
jgi:hypothetical protein